MRILKRTILSLIFRWKNSLAMILIYLVLSSLIFAGMCVFQACRDGTTAMRERIGASITLSNQLSNTQNPYALNSVIEKDLVEKAAALDGIALVNSATDVLVWPENFRYVPVVEGSEGHLPTIHVIGFLNPEENEDILNGLAWLEEGSLSGGFAIHRDLADENGISIGDTLTVTGPKGRVSLPVSGIYGEDQSPPQNEPAMNMENTIFASAEDTDALLGLDRVSRARFHIHDSLHAESAALRIWEVVEDSSYCETMAVTVDTEEYDSVAGPLNSVMVSTTALVIGAFFLGAVVLTLLSYLSLRERNYEIGILLSLGESKHLILLQMVLEILIPLMVAIGGSTLSSHAIADNLDILLQNLDIHVELAPIAILGIYVCGLGLTAIASLPTVFRIMRYQPKKILMAMG